MATYWRVETGANPVYLASWEMIEMLEDGKLAEGTKVTHRHKGPHEVVQVSRGKLRCLPVSRETRMEVEAGEVE